MQINELFDKPYSFKWIEQSDEAWKAEAQLSGDDYLVINFNTTDFNLTEWEINFQRGDDYDYKASGAGDEFRVFATVVAAIKEWFKKQSPKPREIFFSGDKQDTPNAESRVRLYDRFARQFAQATGYRMERKELKMSVSWNFVRPKKKKAVKEVEIDNAKGRGQVPMNQDVDYFGLRVKMRPSTFLKLAAPLASDASDEMKDYIRKGGAIGAPFLIIRVEEGEEPYVRSHEGRNRMKAILAVEGDDPVETHLFFRGDVSKARQLTPELIARLKKGLKQQVTGQHVRGPLWEEAAGVGRITKQNTTVDVKPGETQRQAAKFGNKVDKNNRPPELHKKARKNSNAHILTNLGLAEHVQLNELFDQKHDWKWFDKDKNRWAAHFNATHGEKVYVYFLPKSHQSPNWIVNFDLEGSHRRSNKGDQYRIFATVIDIIGKFMQNDEQPVSSIEFSAHKESDNPKDDKEGIGNRAKLYTRMVNKFAQQAGLEFAIDDHDPAEITYLIRKPPSQMNEAEIGNKLTNLSLAEHIQLNELFDKSYNWTWKYNKGRSRKAVFDTDAGDTVNAEFGDLGGDAVYFDFGRNGSHYVTGEGDAFKIFATVMKILADYIRDEKPGKLVFGAEKNPQSGAKMMSRINLYTRMVKKFADAAGYDFDIVDAGFQTKYKLFRKDLKNISESKEPAYQMQLVRDGDEDALIVTSNKSSKWVEVRGKSNYETDGYDPQDPLHQILDKLDPATVAALMAGDTKFLNPNNSRTTPSIKTAQHVMTNETEGTKKIYGYKAMNYNPESGEITSGADKRTTKGVKLRKGMTLRMPGRGIFMSTNRDYVEQYYSGHNDYEALIKFEFDPDEITSGNLTDRENEFTVPSARVVGFKVLDHLNEAVIKKPHPKDTLGVKRADMPQVHKDHYPEFIQYLKDHGASMRHRRVHARDLKPVQSEFSDAGVEKMMTNKDEKKGTTREKPLIVSSDNYIIDGHHRWLASYNLDEDIPVMQFSLPIKRLFQLTKDFKHTTYKDIHEGNLNEALKDAYEYDIYRVGSSIIKAKFETQGGHEVKVVLGMVVDDYYAASLLHYADFDIRDIGLNSNDIWEFFFTRDGDVDLTNQGDQWRVMATVIAIFRDFVSRKKPQVIAFSASKQETGGKGRLPLYRRMARAFAQESGFQVREFDLMDETYFMLFAPSIKLGENISITGTERHKEERKKQLVPGSDAWFSHWFSRPYLKREQVEQLKAEAVKHIKGVRNEKATNRRRSLSDRRTNERSGN